MSELNKFKHDFSKRYWAVLYLYDWDEPRCIKCDKIWTEPCETKERGWHEPICKEGPKKVWPEIHGFYESYEEARDNVEAMGSSADKYYIRPVYRMFKK